MNKYIKLGLLFNGIFIVGNYFDIMPEFIKGMTVAIGLTCYFTGAYIVRGGDISKIKSFKKRFI